MEDIRESFCIKIKMYLFSDLVPIVLAKRDLN